MTPIILITGATGAVSSALLAALEGSDHQIRALVRDETNAAQLQARGVEVVVGDLDDPDSLPPAFSGVSDLWLLVPNGPRATENSMNAVWAARNAGVERVVRLSAVGAAPDAPTRSGRLHALADHNLQHSGLRWTILRPHWFMQNLLNEAAGIAALGTFSLNAGDGRLGMIDVRDIAAFAGRVLTDPSPRHAGRIYPPTGRVRSPSPKWPRHSRRSSAHRSATSRCPTTLSAQRCCTTASRPGSPGCSSSTPRPTQPGGGTSPPVTSSTSSDTHHDRSTTSSATTSQPLPERQPYVRPVRPQGCRSSFGQPWGRTRRQSGSWSPVFRSKQLPRSVSSGS